MSITYESRGSVARIVLTKAVDYSSQDEFKRANDKAIAESNATKIEVDFTEVTFIDSAGIRSLVALQKQASEQNKGVTIVNCSLHIREIFEIGGFEELFDFKGR